MSFDELIDEVLRWVGTEVTVTMTSPVPLFPDRTFRGRLQRWRSPAPGTPTFSGHGAGSDDDADGERLMLVADTTGDMVMAFGLFHETFRDATWVTHADTGRSGITTQHGQFRWTIHPAH